MCVQSGMKLIRFAANHHVCVHIIQCRSSANVAKLEALPKATNGEHWIVTDSLPMTTACRRAADLLSYHYVLSYRTEKDSLISGIPTLSVAVNHKQFKSRMTVQLRKL